jgi:hypothetical protein
MKKLLFFLVIGLVVFAATSCSKKTIMSDTTRNDSLVYRFKDSARTKDSLVTKIKDSVVVREAVHTTFEVDARKPFSYRFSKGNVLVFVQVDTSGKAKVDVDISAELAYWQHQMEVYQEHLKDSVSSDQNIEYIAITKTVTVRIVRKVWPFWVWLIVIGAVLLLSVQVYQLLTGRKLLKREL